VSSLKYNDGWLDPDGIFYPLPVPYLHCEWCIQKAYATCQTAEWGPIDCHLDLSGWIKLTKGEWIIARPSKMTQRQYDFIYDWHVRNGRDLTAFRKIAQDLQDTNLL
jgi:hypothetical protein